MGMVKEGEKRSGEKICGLFLVCAAQSCVKQPLALTHYPQPYQKKGAIIGFSPIRWDGVAGRIGSARVELRHISIAAHAKKAGVC